MAKWATHSQIREVGLMRDNNPARCLTVHLQSHLPMAVV